MTTPMASVWLPPKMGNFEITLPQVDDMGVSLPYRLIIGVKAGV